MRSRQEGDTWLFEQRGLRVLRFVGVASLLACVAFLWLYDFPYEYWSLSVPLTLLVKPGIELQVSPESITRRSIWWIPLRGNVGGSGREMLRSEVKRVFIDRDKTGSSSNSGSDTMVWTPILVGEKNMRLWTFGSKDRAEAVGHRLAELLGTDVKDMIGVVRKRDS